MISAWAGAPQKLTLRQLFLDRRQRGPIRSVLMIMIVWLVSWLVGNVFSETAPRIFLIFCMKLGDYKGRKVSKPDFWKEFLIWRYSWKSLQISPKSNTLIFFSKTALTAFSDFGLKLALNMTFNLNETCFSEKFAISRYLASKSSKKIAQTEVFGHFLNFTFLVSLDFAHNDRWAWCLIVFLQFACPGNVFLLKLEDWILKMSVFLLNSNFYVNIWHSDSY